MADRVHNADIENDKTKTSYGPAIRTQPTIPSKAKLQGILIFLLKRDQYLQILL